MKKVYVTPVMESEAFVANEYVAACWWVTCQPDDLQDIANRHRACRDHSVRVGESEPELHGGMFLWGDNWYYVEINGKLTDHPVSKADHALIFPDHPNSSV
ncbi:MAG: hypothetical protein MR416_09025 [Lachnospiraceae bacterium]|nr:hypothetical protein [Lachnospiraceae bacterium]